MVVSLQAVVQVVIFLLVAGAIFWLLNWLIDYCGLQDPFRKFAKIFLAVAAVLILIGLLLSFAGMPIVRLGP